MIKKIVLNFFFFVGICFPLLGQLSLNDEDYRRKLYLGFQLSPSISWMSTNDNMVNGNGANLGLRLGIIGEYYFKKHFALVSGINLSFNQGGTLHHERGGNLWSNSELSESTLTTLPDAVDLKYHIRYVEIPFGLKVQTKEKGYFRYFAELPSFVLGIRVRARGDIENTIQSNSEQENIVQDVNSFNLSWGLGAGMHYTISEETEIVVGLYYRQGFIDVTNNDAIKVNGQPEDSKAIIKNISIKMGILF